MRGAAPVIPLPQPLARATHPPPHPPVTKPSRGPERVSAAAQPCRNAAGAAGGFDLLAELKRLLGLNRGVWSHPAPVPGRSGKGLCAPAAPGVPAGSAGVAPGKPGWPGPLLPSRGG